LESGSENWAPVPVSSDLAKECVNNWINPSGREGTPSPAAMRAFAASKAELQALLDQIETEYVRMYIGRRVHVEDGLMHPCLLMVSAVLNKDLPVPVTDDPEEEIIDLIDTYPVGAAPGSPGSVTYLIYDFTKPCPPRCDPSSKLFVPANNGQDCG